MDLPSETEVLIVGAGPVGATLANLCGKLGLRTLLIDKLPEIQSQPRAMTVDNEALRILQQAGLPETAFPRRVIPKVCLRSPLFGQFAQMNTGGVIDAHPMLVTFFQPELEQALQVALSHHPTVQVARPVEWLESHERDGACVVSLGLADGRIHLLQTRFVVAADGASSTVRRALGLGFHGSSYQEDWLIIDALNAGKNNGHIEFLCDPRRPTPNIPGPGERQRWEFMLHADERREQMLQHDTIKTLLSRWIDIDRVTIERTAVYRFHARTATKFRAGRTLLVGDAAHVSPPFIGQGLVAGLRDASNLAWKLAWVVQGRADQRILDSYHTERQPHAWAMIRLAKWMGMLVMPRSRFAAFVAHGFARLLTLTPGVRSLIVEIKIKPKNRFKRGLFLPRRAGNRFEHGNHLAQGRLRNGSGTVMLSDDVLGQTLQLIGLGVDPQAALSPARRAIWQALGGTCVTIVGTGSQSETIWMDVDNTFGVPNLPSGWIIAVRPDKVIIADGNAQDADAIVTAVANLLR